MDLEEIIQRRGKIIPNKKPLSLEVKKSISLLMFTLLSIIILIVMVYLLNNTQDGQKGYVLKQEQLKKEELESQSRELINKIIQAKSYQSLENNPLIKSMIKPEKLEYIKEKTN
jgi:uncharacterized protein YxeA